MSYLPGFDYDIFITQHSRELDRDFEM